MVTKEKMRNGRLSLLVIKKNQVPNKSVNNKRHKYTQMIIVRSVEKKINGIYSDIKVQNYDRLQL